MDGSEFTLKFNDNKTELILLGYQLNLSKVGDN